MRKDSHTNINKKSIVSKTCPVVFMLSINIPHLLDKTQINYFMKKRILLLTLLLIFKTGFSQLVEHLSAKEAGVVKFPNLYGFFNKGKDGIFHTEVVEKGKQRTYMLEKFNSDLSNLFSQGIPLEEKEEYQFFTIKQNKIFFFTTLYDGKDKSFFLRILDNNTGKVISEKQKLSSLPSDPFGTNGRNFPILFSPDETKMMIVSSFQWPKKPQDVKAEVYDLSSMKIITTMNIPGDYENTMIKSRSYAITDQGNILFIMKTDSKEKNVIIKETLALYETSSKSYKYQDLPFEKKKIENSYTFLKNGNFYITGVFKDDYSKKEDKENKAGVFCVAVDSKNFKLVTSDFNYFSTEIDTKLSYKDGQRKKELSEKEFTSKEIIQTVTGFYLIENLTYTSEITKGNTTVYKPYSREFIISKFNNTGKLEFVKVIPKNTADKMYGDDIVESNDNLFVFYCEHPKNLEKFSLENFDPKEYNDVGDLRGPVAVCVKVDAKGNLSRQELFANETWCYYPGTGIILKEGKDLVVMEIEKDKYSLNVFRIKK